MWLRTHDQETDADGLRDADELLLVGLWEGVLGWRMVVEGAMCHRTGAAVQEESALLEELGGHTTRMLAAIRSHMRVWSCVLGKLLDVLHGG